MRVKVSACGVCRTDLHVVEGDLREVRLPLVPGHQVVGWIEKLGGECRSLRVGARVGIAWLRSTDGTCVHCCRNRENLCPEARFTGYNADGGYAEYAVVDERFAYAIPDEYDDAAATPLLCAGIIGFRSLERASVPESGTLLIVGFGSSAHIVIQLARYRGQRVLVVTREARHRELAAALGAEWVGADYTGLPRKADGAILFAPAGDLVPPCLEALDRGGVLALAGIHLSDLPSLNYAQHLFFERELRSVTANTREDGRRLLLEAVAARIQPQVTKYRLEEANEALLDLKEDRVAGTAVLVVHD